MGLEVSNGQTQPDPAVERQPSDTTQNQDLVQKLKHALELDLKSAKMPSLEGAFRYLVHGTPTSHPLSQLSEQGQAEYKAARERALRVSKIEGDRQFKEGLEAFFTEAAKTPGGRAYLSEALHSIAMNAPGQLDRTTEAIENFRPQVQLDPTDPHLTPAMIGQLRRGAAEASVLRLHTRAKRDDTRPVLHPAPLAGWTNDPNGMHYDEQGRLHVGFQHNPWGDDWNHMHWAHGCFDANGRFQHLPIMLEPQPENGYHHNFSGSMLAVKIPHPDHPDKMVNAAFFTAVGTGENGFLGAPPNVMAITSDPTLVAWEAKRFELTTPDTFRGKIDTINGNERIENRYDVRDPNVFRRNGEYFMILAGTRVKDRQGGGVIALCKPSNPDNLGEPWEYVGDMFRHPLQTLDEGGPGIIECPNIQFLGETAIIFYGAQRKPEDGNLAGYHHHEAVQYRIGKFNTETGQFTTDPHEGAAGVLDYGRAFYAPNSTPRPDGKGITVMGWVKGHEGREDWKDLFEGNRGWSGCGTFPRTITLRDGVPHIAPDAMVDELRTETLHKSADLTVTSETLLEGIDCNTLDITTRLQLGENTESATMKVLAREDGTGGLDITFDGEKLLVGDEHIPLYDAENPGLTVDLRVIVDRSVVEVYANGKVLTKIVTPTKEHEIEADESPYADQVMLSSKGGKATFGSFSAYRMDR